MVRPSTNWSPSTFTAWRTAWRMTGSPERATRRFKASTGLAPRASRSLTTRPVSISPQVEALTSRLSEWPRCFSQWPLGDLLGDQLIGRLGIGDAQQRLGDAHQDDAFLAGKAVLAHEGVDAGVLAAVGARRIDEPARQVGRAATLVLREHGALDQAVEQALLVDEMVGGDLVARRQLRKFDHFASGLGVRHCDHSVLVRRASGAIRFNLTLANRRRGCLMQAGDDARA